MSYDQQSDYFLLSPNCFQRQVAKDQVPITIHLIQQSNLEAQIQASKQSDVWRRWCQSNDFTASAGQLLAMPGADGQLQALWIGIERTGDCDFYALWGRIPAGFYRFSEQDAPRPELYLAWAKASYCYRRCQSDGNINLITMYLPDEFAAKVEPWAQVEYAVRDLINTPANEMTPADLSKVMAALAQRFEASFKEVVGSDLLAENYPAIYAVGCASDSPPRLLELCWGDADAPELVLVGKGVCFDTGGLNIKPTSAMSLMKKDMSGGAHVLGLAYLIMQSHLPVKLRVLVPAVENAIGAGAYRPGDILNMRSGLKVEVTDTDCEGRLVLADAMTEGFSTDPDLLIDMASLTGAARSALGPDIVPFFTRQADLADDLIKHAYVYETLFQLPIYQPYDHYLNTPVADLKNSTGNPYAGAIVAALFLQRFVPDHAKWLHFDIFAWRYGDETGAAVQGLYSLLGFLEQRYAT